MDIFNLKNQNCNLKSTKRAIVKKVLYSITILLAILTTNTILTNAATSNLPAITSGKNGSAVIKEVTGNEEYKYVLTVKPKTGYYVKQIKQYYEKGSEAYIDVNLARFELTEDNEYTWNIKSWDLYSYNKFEIIYGKIKTKAILHLTTEKNVYGFKEDIAAKITLKDENGKSLKINKDGILSMIETGTGYSGRNYYKNSQGSDIISSSDSITIYGDSITVMNKDYMEFRVYYVDRTNDIFAYLNEFKIPLSKIKADLTFKNLNQDINNLRPVEAVDDNNGTSARVYYKNILNGNDNWSSVMPTVEGQYEVKASLENSVEHEATAINDILTITDQNNINKEKSKTFQTSYNQNNYLKLTIDNFGIYYDGKVDSASDRMILSCEGNNTVKLDLSEAKTFNGSFNVEGLPDGRYSINQSIQEQIGNNTYSGTSDDIIFVIKDREVFFEKGIINRINENEFSKIEASSPSNNLKSDSITSDVKQMALNITKDAETDYDKIKLIYAWVADNIYYDNNSASISSSKILQTRRAVCEGYSILTMDLLKSIGIPCIIDEGYSAASQDAFLSGPGHAWNYAYCNNLKRWIILDTTWGSKNKYENNTKIYKGFDYDYFDISLEKISIDHLFEAIKTKEDPIIINSCTIKIGEEIKYITNDPYPKINTRELSIPDDKGVIRISGDKIQGIKQGTAKLTIKLNNGWNECEKTITIKVVK